MLITTVEIIEQSWTFYKKYWRQFKIYIFFLFLPTLVLSILANLGLYLDYLIPASAMVSNIIILAVLAASILFWIWTIVALTRTIRELNVTGRTSAWQSVFNASGHLIWPYIAATILVGLVIFGGTILFIIPGIIFYVWFRFTTLAVILDEKQPGSIAAMRASKRLVSGRWWAMLLRLVLPNLLFGAISAVAVALLAWPLNAVSSGVFNVILHNGLSAIVAALVAPLTTATLVILYESAKKNPSAAPATPTL